MATPTGHMNRHFGPRVEAVDNIMENDAAAENPEPDEPDQIVMDYSEDGSRLGTFSKGTAS